MNLEAASNWFRGLLRKTRPYRFEGEEANHRQQTAEVNATLAHMASEAEDPELTPERRHWLNEHRAGMENMLAEFEKKPRLSVEEMNQRDAIETHLYGAPLQRGGVARVRGFLPVAAAHPAMAVLLSPWTWFVALGAFCVLQMGLKERVENQRDEARHELAEARESMEALVAMNDRLQTDINNANRDAASTAETYAAERARRVAAEREAARIRNEQRRASEHAPTVDYGFGSVRDSGAGSAGASGRDPASGNPG